MEQQKKEKTELEIWLESSSLPEESQNLRRKIESICRTIENLSSKKLNLELEIKTQKKVLARKRLELKKRSKTNQVRIQARLESTGDEKEPKEVQELARIDQKLLRESASILEE